MFNDNALGGRRCRLIKIHFFRFKRKEGAGKRGSGLADRVSDNVRALKVLDLCK